MIALPTVLLPDPDSPTNPRISPLLTSIFTFLAAVLVIAGRQLGLAILMHEGAHGLITNNTKLNNHLSQWICAFPVWSDTYGYRHYHLAHHRNTQLEDLGRINFCRDRRESQDPGKYCCIKVQIRSRSIKKNS